jgi:hypothetical protein
MRHGSAALIEPVQAHSSLLNNPASDFTAAPAIHRLSEVTGRVLSEIPHAVPVTITGTIDLVRIYGDETALEVYPRAAVLLNSGTGATTVLNVDQRHYLMTWGHLVRGNTVRVYGRVLKAEPAAPAVIDLVRINVLRKAGA